MTEPLRTSGVVNYRRYVIDTIIQALQAAFDNTYARERQLTNLHIVNKLPLEQAEYPAIVVDFVDRRVSNAGVGHEEWFPDANGVVRKWHHSRFEGSINLDLYARTPLDRDVLADALMELLRFGRLDSQLLQFFADVYPGFYYGDTYLFLLNQLMINVDEIDGRGSSTQQAPWAAEDVLIHSIGYSLETHGGFYNEPITTTIPYLSDLQFYPYSSEDVELVYDGHVWTNPFDHFDVATVSGEGQASARTHPETYHDAGTAIAYSTLFWTEI